MDESTPATSMIAPSAARRLQDSITMPRGAASRANDWNPTGGSLAVAAFTSPFRWTTAGHQALASSGRDEAGNHRGCRADVQAALQTTRDGQIAGLRGKATEQIGAEWPDGTGDDRGGGKSQAQDLWDNWQDVK
jgi:hypothetical protein